MASDLEAAYVATTYFAETPRGRLAVRVGEVNAPLDTLLAEHGTRHWSYLTAFNPMSRALSAAENERRHRELLSAVADRPHFEGESIADAGDWPAERSVLVLGMDEAAGLQLGRHFGQAAIVVGERGVPAHLAWCLEGQPSLS